MSNSTASRRRPRASTIVWGCILVTVSIAAYIASTIRGREVPPAAILWTVLGFGAVLVLAALVALVVRAATGNRVDDARIPAAALDADGTGAPDTAIFSTETTDTASTDARG